jgi:uncharacterized protein YkwD
MKKWFLIGLILILAIAAGGGTYLHFKKPKAQKTTAKTAQTSPSPPTTPQPQPQIDTAEIHGLINQERTKAGLKTLVVSDKLVDSATAKCEDMKKNNYFTHTSPGGVDYTTFIKKEILNPKLTGENLGAGYLQNQELITEWMQSDQHKANILNPKFTAEGIAVCGKASEKPGLIIVAHFVKS